MANRQATVFYSWQSDSSNATNRGLIGTALESAVKAIRDDESIRVDPVVDRDTLGLPGSPEIHKAIFDKIERAAAFVADVSIVNPDAAARRTPNPNVLLELGYATRAIGESRIILVMNTAFGGPEQLPFDLRMRRVLTYESATDATERAPARRLLTAQLEAALRPILAEIEKTPTEEPLAVRFKRILDDASKRIEVADLVGTEANRLREMLDREDLMAPWSPDELRNRAQRYEAAAAPLVEMFALAGRWAPSVHDALWRPTLERIANPVTPGGWMEVWYRLRRYPALRVLYAGGIAATAAGKWAFVKSLLIDTPIDEMGSLSPAALVLHAPDTFGDAEKYLPDMERRRAPLADHLFTTLRELLRDQFPTDREYDSAVERFEAIVALVHADLRTNTLHEWCPIGRFAWRRRDVFKTIAAEAGGAEGNWPPLKAGMFGGQYRRCTEALGRVQAFLTNVSTW